VLKWLKFFLAILLLPVCAGAAGALLRVLQASGQADTFWVALAGGAACWIAIYLFLPKPMWIYVFGHELTHAIWVWLCGGQVKKFKASAKGGHVIVTKDNFLIALAPYFFPLYATLVVAAFATGNLIWNLRPYLVWFHLLLGAAYAFHVTLTCHVLKTSQSDITSHGYLFSVVVIFIGNIAILLVGIPLLAAQLSVLAALRWWAQDTTLIINWLSKGL
jgi:hypothetical protein